VWGPGDTQAFPGLGRCTVLKASQVKQRDRRLRDDEWAIELVVELPKTASSAPRPRGANGRFVN
jgi:hypothetical protein